MVDESVPRRGGIFWESVEGRAPAPRAAQTLGFRLLAADPAAGSIRVAFDGSQAFTNPRGEVLGGFLAAMLYDTVGPALLATIGEGEFIETDDLEVRFLEPAQPGPMVGQGKIADRTGQRATLTARLWDHTGAEVASGLAHARIIPLRPAPEDRGRTHQEDQG